MSRAGAKRIGPVRPGFGIAAAAATAAFTLGGCVMSRQGPPAPVVDRSGIYYTSPAAPRGPVGPEPGMNFASNRAPRPGTVTAVELSPPPDMPGRFSRQQTTAPPSRTSAAPPPARTSAAPPPARTSAAPPPGKAGAPDLDANAVEAAAAELTFGLDPRSGAAATAKAAGSNSVTGRITVRSGDTLYSISRRENVPLRALIDANELKPPYVLRAGQSLNGPSVRVYVVAPGDTVATVAARYDVAVGDVIRQNDLKAPDYGLVAGQRLVLPWGGAAGEESATARAPGAAEPGATNAAIRQIALRAPDPPSARIELADPDADPPKRAAGKFLWPVRGPVVSGFGSKGGGLFNDGINIAAPDGEVVRAAENGIVAYVGNELRGYGNLLLLRHADGWVSAYAHNGELLVRRGQVVQRGQPIATVGRSGAVARPQLHFELRRGRKAVDPTAFLSS